MATTASTTEATPEKKPARQRPPRARTTTSSTAKAEAAPSANREVLALVPVGTTKTYSKWQAPEGSGCAGNFYAPLGVTEVKVAYTKP